MIPFLLTSANITTKSLSSLTLCYTWNMNGCKTILSQPLNSTCVITRNFFARFHEIVPTIHVEHFSDHSQFNTKNFSVFIFPTFPPLPCSSFFLVSYIILYYVLHMSLYYMLFTMVYQNLPLRLDSAQSLPAVINSVCKFCIPMHPIA